jgi:hypothetical protein
MVEMSRQNQWTQAGGRLQAHQDVAEGVAFALQIMIGANRLYLGAHGVLMVGGGWVPEQARSEAAKGLLVHLARNWAPLRAQE